MVVVVVVMVVVVVAVAVAGYDVVGGDCGGCLARL